MAAKEIIVKKYVVRLSGDEREQLAALIRKGSSPVHRLLKARILLKADVSEAGEGWSDHQIIDALGTSASMVYRVHFLNAKKIVLVQDNLNTHTKASLYEAFPAAEARRLAKRFEWHYTPKHGNWLDMAESGLGVLSSQCLDRRIPDKQTLSTKSQLGRMIEIPTPPRPIGSSPQPMLGSNSNIYTHQSD